MAAPKLDLPYFDLYLRELDKGNDALEKIVGRNVHWGFWPDPSTADGSSADDFAAAAERLTHRLLQWARPAAGQEILDVGCGFGGTIALMNEQYESLRLTGLNIDARQLERARRNVQSRARAMNTIRFVEGDACALPFADASFDTVLAVECIFHFPSRQKFFEEAYRVLRPGGRLVLSDFLARAPLFPIIAVLFPWFRRDLERIHGRSNQMATMTTYRGIERRVKLRRIATEDITRQTFPTYASIRHFAHLFGDDAPSFRRAMRFIELITRLGAYRYRTFAFEKV